ncbi:nucleophile aminohydrolase [Mycena galopus ATCC 62051]|nr:nucleophile aminohydrolase [Mycena galopus ATCC 62051]
MAVQFTNSVVIGADSCTTMGSYIANRVTDKLTHVHDRVYCCRSGSAADTQAVADIVHYHLQVFSQTSGAPPPVHTAATIFQKLCYENKDMLSAGIIVAGWDRRSAPACTTSLSAVGSSVSRSDSTYVYGYCDATYQEGWGRDENDIFQETFQSEAGPGEMIAGGFDDLQRRFVRIC